MFKYKYLITNNNNDNQVASACNKATKAINAIMLIKRFLQKWSFYSSSQQMSFQFFTTIQRFGIFPPLKMIWKKSWPVSQLRQLKHECITRIIWFPLKTSTRWITEQCLKLLWPINLQSSYTNCTMPVILHLTGSL